MINTTILYHSKSDISSDQCDREFIEIDSWSPFPLNTASSIQQIANTALRFNPFYSLSADTPLSNHSYSESTQATPSGLKTGRHSVTRLPEQLQDMKNLTLPDGRILEIKIEDDSGLKKSAEIKGEDKTLYLSWSFDNQTGNLELEYEHRNDLPAWIKIPEKEHCEFDQRKGIPTIQVLKAMIINALECTGKVKSISVRSTNARTTTDVVYSTFVEKKDFKTACEHSTTALLAREAGEMCGTSVQLTEVEGRKSCQVTEKNFIDRISKRNLSSPSDQSTPQKYLGEDKIKTILECMGTATWTIYQEIDMRFEAIHA